MKIETEAKPVINGYQYSHFDDIYTAVFNCREASTRKGRAAVLEKFGAEGWAKVQGMMKSGIMEIFNHDVTPETLLYAQVVGEHADRYWTKRSANTKKA